MGEARVRVKPLCSNGTALQTPPHLNPLPRWGEENEENIDNGDFCNQALVLGKLYKDSSILVVFQPLYGYQSFNNVRVSLLC